MIGWVRVAYRYFIINILSSIYLSDMSGKFAGMCMNVNIYAWQWHRVVTKAGSLLTKRHKEETRNNAVTSKRHKSAAEAASKKEKSLPWFRMGTLREPRMNGMAKKCGDHQQAFLLLSWLSWLIGKEEIYRTFIRCGDEIEIEEQDEADKFPSVFRIASKFVVTYAFESIDDNDEDDDDDLRTKEIIIRTKEIMECLHTKVCLSVRSFVRSLACFRRLRLLADLFCACLLACWSVCRACLWMKVMCIF